MNTQQLESFVQVAENLSFARAAEVLNVTTSAVSRQISSLEDELNTKLLRRTTKNVSLTPSGIIFYNDAKEILAKLELSARKINHLTEKNMCPISIGYTDEADPDLMSQLLKRCKEQLPEIHPFLRITSLRLLLNMLIHDEIDVLFCFKDDIPMRESFIYAELAQIPICCVVPKGHYLSHKEEISNGELLSESIVICNSQKVPSQIAGIQNLIINKLPINRTYYSENVHAMQTLIKAGYGIGIFPEMASDNSELTYIPLAQEPSLSYGVFYKDNSKNSILKKFLSLLNVK